MSRFKAILSSLVLALGVANAFAAPTMLVDRGLPTTNVNNAAGSNRSNVAWVEGDYSSSTAPYTVLGDSFTNTSGVAWSISNIRVWIVGDFATARLLGGVEGGSLGVASTSYTASSTLYANSESYQGYSGAFRALTQIDFAVNLLLGAGETFDFFLDGTGAGQYVVPFMHASNAALSGSPQDGSNDQMLSARLTGGSFGPVSTWTSLNNGWDKASDFNVQVEGQALPEPGSLALVGIAAFGLAASRRRRS